eukprot:303775-Amphidinium_carterae.1
MSAPPLPWFLQCHMFAHVKGPLGTALCYFFGWGRPVTHRLSALLAIEAKLLLNSTWSTEEQLFAKVAILLVKVYGLIERICALEAAMSTMSHNNIYNYAKGVSKCRI